MSIFDPDQLQDWTHGQWKATPRDNITGFSIDSRNLNKGDVFVAVNAVRDGHDFLKNAAENGASAGIVEEVKLDVSLPQLLVNDTIQAFHDIAYNHRLKFEGPVVGVTGSCGKTSTKDILGILLGEGEVLSTKGNLNNYLGVPLTLLRTNNEVHKYAVIEAGINQMGEMSMLARTIAPTIVLVTIIAPSHLEGLESIEKIASEKANLFLDSNRTETVLFPEECLQFPKFSDQYENGEDAIVLREGQPSSNPNPKEAFYSIWTETNKYGGSPMLRLWQCESPTVTFPMPQLSRGMGKNAALAVLAALRLGVSVQEISERLPRFRPSALRGKCFQGRGRSYFVDCYNANPASMIDSIDFFRNQYTERSKLYILGGMEELGKKSQDLHFKVGSAIKLEDKDLVILIGEKASWMAPALIENGYQEKVMVLGDIEDAIPLVEDFEGVVLFKGSRINQLEKLLPPWAVDDDSDGNNEKC